MENDTEKYRELISAIELRDIFLLELYVKRPSDEPKGGLIYDIIPEFELAEKNNDMISVNAKFTLEGYEECDEEKIDILNINATFRLTYSLSYEIDVSENIIEKFVKMNVPINSWPYFREIITSTTTRVGYPSLTIGTLKR